MPDGDGMAVHPDELSAGVGKIAPLFGDCEMATIGVAETLGNMVGAAGHPGLASALTSFTESSAKALASTGKAITYIGAGLKESAAEYQKTESSNANRIKAAHPGSH